MSNDDYFRSLELRAYGPTGTSRRAGSNNRKRSPKATFPIRLVGGCLLYRLIPDAKRKVDVIAGKVR